MGVFESTIEEVSVGFLEGGPFESTTVGRREATDIGSEFFGAEDSLSFGEGWSGTEVDVHSVKDELVVLRIVGDKILGLLDKVEKGRVNHFELLTLLLCPFSGDFVNVGSLDWNIETVRFDNCRVAVKFSSFGVE